MGLSATALFMRFSAKMPTQDTLLDEEKGGGFYVKPEWDTYTFRQQYISNTNVLETIYDCEDGSYKVTDFVPGFLQYERYFKPLLLFRKVEPVKGRRRIRVSCRPLGNYGETKPEMVFGSSHSRYEGLETNVRPTTNILLTYLSQEQAFVLNETKYLILTWGVPFKVPLAFTAGSYLDKSVYL